MIPPIYIYMAFFTDDTDLLEEKLAELPPADPSAEGPPEPKRKKLEEVSAAADPSEEVPPEPKQRSCIPNQLVVIGEEEISAGEVSIYKLPDLESHSSYYNSSFCVAKSRLFFVGGHYLFFGLENGNGHGILSLQFHKENMDNNISWVKSPLGSSPTEFFFVGGTAVVSKEGGGAKIYAIGGKGNVCVFDSESMTVEHNVDNAGLPHLRHFLLAVSSTRIYVNCVSSDRPPKGGSVFGYYDVSSLSWNIIHPATARLFFQRDRAVVVRDEYLIYYADHHPEINPNKFSPGLYVYDILNDKWLDEQVKDLPKDGKAFPSSDPPFEHGRLNYEHGDKFGDPIMYSSLMQVCGGEQLKLAFVWNTLNQDKTSELHFSRFTLDVIDAGAGAGAHPTFCAKHVCFQQFSVPTQAYYAKSTVVHA